MAKNHILIIDDEEIVRESLQRILEDAGFYVSLSANGNQGIKACAENLPDLVITDIIMPEKEGIETIIHLKKNYPDLRIIAISGGHRNSSFPVLDMAAELGADKVLLKPFRRKNLLDAIEELLDQAAN